jgi:hypothetical protein
MNYRNPVKIREDYIDCEIEHPKYGWIPFTCYKYDKGSNFDVFALYNRMINDPNLKILEPRKISEEEIVKHNSEVIRNKRNILLSKYVDPIVSNPLRWNDINPQKKYEIVEYRRKLLDITKQENFPYSVQWPSVPKI